jgi:vacuolar-type H+-ATPase subunit E/Vma4
MGLNEIEKEIRKIGKKDIDSMLREANAEIKKMTKEIEAETYKRSGKLRENASKEIDLERKRIIARANLKIKEKIEKRKDEMVESVFGEAEKRILEMSEKEKAKIMKALADEAKKGLDKPEVFVDRKYSKLLPGAKTAEIGDLGVVVKSGHVSVNNTLRAKLDEIKSGSRHKVAELLWRK